MTQPPPGEIAYNLKTSVGLPNAESEKRLAIRIVDWTRIKRKITRIDPPPTILSRLSDICLSIAATAGFTIIPLWDQRNAISSWILPILGCITILFLFFGGCFFYINNKDNERRQKEAKDFEQDMTEIEKTFESC